MRGYTIEFDGRMLGRGFWIYVWSIRSAGKRVLYVGRTGDTSSTNAASPFSRVSAHLNLKPNAKGNSLVRRLLEAGLSPERCRFRMHAVGPIEPEAELRENHILSRDRMAGLERALADELRNQGFNVVGTHPRQRSVDKSLLAELLRQADEFLSEE